MDVEAQESLRHCAALLALLDGYAIALATWLFWGSVTAERSSAIVYFSLLVVAIFYFGFKALYYIECAQQDKRILYSWNRRYEWLPIAFLFINTAQLATLGLIYLLHVVANITIAQAAAALSVTSAWLLASIGLAAALTAAVSVRAMHLHRSNSVCYAETDAPAATIALRPQRGTCESRQM